MKWYQKTWVCVLLLVCFPPAGILLVWKFHGGWAKAGKITATVLSSLWLLIIIGAASAEPSPAPESVVLPEVQEALDIGEERELVLEVKPENARTAGLTLHSTDDTVASIRWKDTSRSACIVRAAGEGDAFVSIEYNGTAVSSRVKLTVEDKALWEQVQEVIRQIDGIGEAGEAGEETLLAARRLYQELPAKAQARVTNYAALERAEQAFRQQQESRRRVEEAEKAIGALGSITEQSGDAIGQARKAYDSLSEQEKEQVSNRTVLTDAEKKLAELKRQAEKQAELQKQAELKKQQEAAGWGSSGSSGGNAENFNTYDIPEQQNTQQYVLNTNTKKFHKPSCRDVKKISPKNYSTAASREAAIRMGYSPCGHCHP